MRSNPLLFSAGFNIRVHIVVQRYTQIK